mmetsp:Transcript_40281/g.97239  ORF Transcript_40281/g.97239 Transcript_40281/m.97239 type:complete len:223 (+) Transcript_40281:883-1551(+)
MAIEIRQLIIRALFFLFLVVITKSNKGIVNDKPPIFYDLVYNGTASYQRWKDFPLNFIQQLLHQFIRHCTVVRQDDIQTQLKVNIFHLPSSTGNRFVAGNVNAVGFARWLKQKIFKEWRLGWKRSRRSRRWHWLHGGGIIYYGVTGRSALVASAIIIIITIVTILEAKHPNHDSCINDHQDKNKPCDSFLPWLLGCLLLVSISDVAITTTVTSGTCCCCLGI